MVGRHVAAGAACCWWCCLLVLLAGAACWCCLLVLVWWCCLLLVLLAAGDDDFFQTVVWKRMQTRVTGRRQNTTKHSLRCASLLGTTQERDETEASHTTHDRSMEHAKPARHRNQPLQTIQPLRSQAEIIVSGDFWSRFNSRRRHVHH